MLGRRPASNRGDGTASVQNSAKPRLDGHRVSTRHPQDTFRPLRFRRTHCVHAASSMHMVERWELDIIPEARRSLPSPFWRQRL
jgi:hypothetical protein